MQQKPKKLLDRVRDALRVKHYSYTQNQALRALLFLYRHMLNIELIDRSDAVRAKKEKCLPTVPTLHLSRRHCSALPLKNLPNSSGSGILMATSQVESPQPEERSFALWPATLDLLDR